MYVYVCMFSLHYLTSVVNLMCYFDLGKNFVLICVICVMIRMIIIWVFNIRENSEPSAHMLVIQWR